MRIDDTQGINLRIYYDMYENRSIKYLKNEKKYTKNRFGYILHQNLLHPNIHLIHIEDQQFVKQVASDTPK